MKGSLAGYTLAFIAGFGVGCMYHHIASSATAGAHELDGSARMRSVEARLAQLEARVAVPEDVASELLRGSMGGLAAPPRRSGGAQGPS